MRRKSSRIIAIVLVMAMVIATLNMNTSVRAEEAIEKEIATSSDAESESIKSDEEKDSTKSEEVGEVDDSEEEHDTAEMDQEDLVAFSQSQSVDGVRVTVTASEGAFPEGATLSVNKVTDSEKEQINQAVEAVREDSVSVAQTYTFDIKVLDENGTELQPANGQTVNVSFAMDEVSNQNLSTDIYHIPEENGSLVAEELSTSESGNTVTAVSDGFSYYTVEFTYNEKQYVMEGDSSVALTDILSCVGITKADGNAATDSDITEVSVSDESLFSASNESGEWIVTAHQAFTSNEWMKVTVDGVEYEIVVTDAIYRTTTNYTASGWDDVYFVYDGAASYTIDGGGIASMSPDKSSGTNSWNAAIAADGTLTYNGTSYGKLSSGKNAWHLYWDSNASNVWAFAGSLVWAQAYVAPPSWTVIYNTNAGSDTVTGLSSTTATVNQGSSTTLPTLTRAGYTFNGWYTEASGGSKVGDGGASYTPTANVTLYAQWTAVPAIKPTIDSVTGSTLTYGYNSGTVSVSATSASGHTLSYQWYDSGTTNSNSGGTKIDGATSETYNIPTEKNTGEYYYYCVITATRNDNSQVATETSDVATVIVNKAAGSINYKHDSVEKTYGAPAFTNDLTHKGDGAVIFESNNPDVATVDNSGKVTIVGAGSAQITATVQEGSNYTYSVNTASYLLDVEKSGINPTVTMSSWTYGDEMKTPSVSGNDGMGTVTYMYKLQDSNDGTYNDVKPSVPGEYTVKATIAETANYKGSSTTANFVINNRPLEITADSDSKTYDGTALKKNSYKLTNSTSLAAGDEIESVTFTGEQIEVGSSYNVASAAVIKKGSENVTSYYDISYKTGTLEVKKKTLTITAKDKTITYGDEPSNDGVTYVGFENGETESILSGNLEYSYTYTQYGDVGTYEITPSGLTSDNYDISFVAGTLTVGKKEIGIVWSDKELTYNSENQKPVATATGMVNDDDCSIAVSGEKEDVGTYTATVASCGNNNYKLPADGDEQLTTSFTIKPKEITAVSDITASDKVYDKKREAVLNVTNNPNSSTLEGEISGDDLTISATGLFEDENAGEDKTVNINSVKLTGSDAKNYVLTTDATKIQSTATATIQPKTVEIEWSNTELIYNSKEQKPTATVKSTDVIDGDTVNVIVIGEQTAANVTEFSDSPNPLYIATATELDNANYKLTEQGHQDFMIRKADAEIVVDSYEETYDGQPHGILVEVYDSNDDTIDLTKQVSADGEPEATIYYSAEELDESNYKTAGSTTKPTFTEIGTNTIYYYVEFGSNYRNSTVSGSQFVSIDRASLIITAENKERFYGEQDPELTYTYEGVVEGEEDLLSGTLEREAGEVQGKYTIKQGTVGIDSDNYDVTFEEGTFTIKRADSGAEFELENEEGVQASIDKTDEEMLDMVLTKEDRQTVEDGAGVKVYFLVDDIGLSPLQKTLIQAVAGDNSTIAESYDISLFKKFSHLDPVQLHETAKPVTFTFKLSEGVLTPPAGYTRTIDVVTIHNGLAKKLSSTLDTEARSVSFPASEFSVFAIVYEDTPIEGEKTDSKTDSKPVSKKTGDPTPVMPLAVMLMASATGAGFTIKKKKK